MKNSCSDAKKRLPTDMCKSGKDSVVLAYTPKVEELLPNYKIQCEQPCCEATFRNWGNYYMHLEKLHQVRDVAKRSFQQYHCPEKGCVYQMQQPRPGPGGDGKFFKSMKYLRQHYQKVHYGKRHTCSQCSRKFLTVGMLNSHVNYECGLKFSCTECTCRFDSRAALHLHCRRQHCKETKSSRGASTKPATVLVGTDDRLQSPEGKDDKALVHTKECTTTLLGAYADISGFPRTIETQTENSNSSDWQYGPMASVEQGDDQPSMGMSSIAHGVSQTDGYPQCEAGVQTDTAHSLTHMHSVATLTLPEDLEDFSIYLRHMETQTDSGFGSLRKASGNNQSSATGSSVATSQACGDDDLFTELGLVNMHTQTNLSSAEWPMPPPPVVSSCAQDELLVSTETQTSFAQCLLDYGEEASTAPDLQNTQYTQTCDFLLTSLFTTQYTQTCDDLLETIFDNEANDYIRDLDRS